MTTFAILGSTFLTILTSRLADVKFQQNLKQLLMYLLTSYALCTIIFCVTALLTSEVLSQGLKQGNPIALNICCASCELLFNLRQLTAAHHIVTEQHIACMLVL